MCPPRRLTLRRAIFVCVRSINAEGQSAGVPPLDVTQNIVSPRYFDTMEIPLLMGRDFNSEDDKSSREVVIINETLARHLFPNEDPLGKRLAFMRGRGQSNYLEIVGIAQDAKYKSLLETPLPHLYVPWLQQYQSTMTLHALVEGDPSSLVAAVRHEVQAIDKNLPVYKVMILAKQLRNSVMSQQLVAELIGIFGFLALLLAGIGLYGLVAYSVTQRTQEIGIRMALGAQKEDILRLIINHSLALTLLGLAIGLSTSFFLSRFLSSSLYGVSATDPATFFVISLILTGVALLASLIPARKAMSIDPTTALRYE
jgi:predicted permease